MSTGAVSTHVLDTARGRPVAGVAVFLEVADPDGTWRELGRGVTDADGRVGALLPGGPPAAGDYRLRFATGDYFRATGAAVFYPEVVVRVRFDAAGGKFHLPLLISPYGYTTYRGS